MLCTLTKCSKFSLENIQIGVNGIPGVDGEPGPQGAPGIDGRNGNDGKDGKDSLFRNFYNFCFGRIRHYLVKFHEILIFIVKQYEYN